MWGSHLYNALSTTETTVSWSSAGMLPLLYYVVLALVGVAASYPQCTLSFCEILAQNYAPGAAAPGTAAPGT